jgi:hypothetical protein
MEGTGFNPFSPINYFGDIGIGENGRYRELRKNYTIRIGFLYS